MDTLTDREQTFYGLEKRMTVIIVTAGGSQASGGVRQAIYLAKSLQQAGYTVHFICNPSKELLVLATGLQCIPLPRKLAETNRLLRSLMPEGESVVVHGFHNWGVKYAAYLGTLWRIQGLPVVCVAHRGVTAKPKNPLPYLLPGIRAFLVNSHAIINILPLLWRRKRAHFVSNCISPERLVPTCSKEQIRKELHIPDEHLVIGTLAHENPQKGAGRLIEAYAKARASMPPSTLVLIGVPEKNYLETATAHGVSKHVRFVSRTEDIANYLQIITLFVFASYFVESQPNVVMEAVSMGLPVISSNIGEVPHMVQQDCLFAPGNTDEIAAKMTELVNNPSRLAQLAVENLAKKSLFSPERRLETILQHYNAVLNESGLNTLPILQKVDASN